MAGRSLAIAFALGLLTVALSCGGKSRVTGNGDDTSSGGVSAGGTNSGAASPGGTSSGAASPGGTSSGGATAGTGGSSIPSGGSTAIGGSAGTSSGGGEAGTSAGGTAGAPNNCGPSGIADGPNGFTLVPDCTGWIDEPDNTLGIQGRWYPFGDQYSGPYDEKCTRVGQHEPADCSIVTSPPPPPALGFPQVIPGEMCTSGEVAVILPCPPGLTTSGCPEHDYANMFGAGIAVNLNVDKSEEGGARHPWDPTPAGIIGFSFEIDTVPLPGLRVEIPMVLTDEEASAFELPSGSTTDQHPDGSPYWGARPTFPASPVFPGVNRVLWSDIHSPRTNYVFDTRRMLGIEFHVPAVATPPKGAYAFCIKNLTMLER